MLRTSPFWFKRQAAPAQATQRSITRVNVQTPGTAVTTDIVGLFLLDDSKANADPNALALYGTWAGTPEVYGSHLGVLSDNGFSKFLLGNGLQKNDWGAGALDTHYNTEGITLSWIERITVATGTRLLQYWQADNEYIELYCLNSTTLRLAVMLGDGTTQTDDITIASVGINDDRFHHFVVNFNPAGDRKARCYINGAMVADTAAVAGVVVFGDAVAAVRRGIGFGCSYTAPDADVSGDVDHCTILQGMFVPVATGLDNRMMHNGIFMRYYGGQMYYYPGALPAEGNAFYGVEEVLYGNEPGFYPNSVFQFTSGVPHWLAAYD